MGRASRRKREDREKFPHLPDTDLAEYMRQRGLITRRYDFQEGMLLGLGGGLFFSVIAGLRLLVFASVRGEARETLALWGLATLFYLVAGAVSGLLFGALRPFRDRYWGKFLTAYLILFVVYGGGRVAVLPLVEENPVPLRIIIPLALMCLVLAPIYVRTTTRTWKQPTNPTAP